MVLVTGGTGFLGSYIIKALINQGIRVRAIRRSGKVPFYISEVVWQQVEWVEGDVLDVTALHDAIQGVDAVIHAAAIVSFSSRQRHEMNVVNVEGTANVVNAAIENNLKRFIHISSVAALGRTTKNKKVNEEQKWEASQSHTQYALSKHYAELEVWRAFAEGLHGVIINPSTILGFGNWHTSSCAIFKNVYREFPWYTEGINGFVGVEDVAEATVQLLQADVTEKRFIINSGNWGFKQLFTAIAEGFGKRAPHLKATPLLGEIAWRLESLKHFFSDGKPLLTKESARVAHSKTSFDNTALLKTLSPFSFTPLEKVIQESCEKYKEAVQKGQLRL